MRSRRGGCQVAEGDRAQAFNRRAWELEVKRLKPVEVKEAIAA